MKKRTSDDTAARELLASLGHELFQTETSASKHCRREAQRLGDSPPALALRAVAEHADAVLSELPGLAERNNMPASTVGRATGAFLSNARDKLLDLLIDSDRSYRGTLLGCRHGLDVVRLLQHLANCLGNTDLDAFCAAWLNTRTVLVQRVEEELAWFARHPDRALRLARRPQLGIAAHP